MSEEHNGNLHSIEATKNTFIDGKRSMLVQESRGGFEPLDEQTSTDGIKTW